MPGPVLDAVRDLALDQARVMLREVDGTILYWSAGLERLYGYIAGEALGRKVQELLHTVYPRSLSSLAADLERRGEWTGELINRRKDGATVVVAVHCALIRGEDGERDLVVVTNTDIEQRRQEAEYYAAIVQSTDDAIIGLTLAGIVTSWNHGAESMFLYPAHEMIGQSITKLLAPDRRREDELILREVAQGNTITHYETLRVRKDGVEIAASLTVSPIRATDGTIVGASTIARDITERRIAEERFQRMQSELAHMGRLNEMGQMASALAHELNQPLTAASNYIAAARRYVEADGASPQKASDALGKAANQVLRAGDIIRRLRGFLAKSGPEKGVEQIERLIEDTSSLAMIDAKFRDIALRFDFHAPDARAVVDRVQFQQVLLNILRNAFEATTEHNRRQVSIATHKRHGEIEIAVSDSGPGLAPEVAENLFQPFITTKENGMGVGLSICRTIVEGFGGRIWHEPAEEGGAVFLFTVPLDSR